MSRWHAEDQIFAIDPGEMKRLPLPFAQRAVLVSGGRPIINGEVAEWSNALAWKACVGQPTEGSNPSLSASFSYGSRLYASAMAAVLHTGSGHPIATVKFFCSHRPSQRNVNMTVAPDGNSAVGKSACQQPSPVSRVSISCAFTQSSALQ